MPFARSTVMARRGMVAAGHPLASAAGLDILRRGGNAMDGALAASAVMGVVQPMMSGVGGDTFLLWSDAATGEVTALCGSGAAPTGAGRDYFLGRGFETMPLRGMLAPSVPGAVDAMVTALARWGSGRFALADLLEAAIAYAEEGVPVAPVVARWMEEGRPLFERFPSTARIFSPEGRPLRAGEILVQHDLAASLRAIASGGRAAFYDGALADAIVAYAQAHDGLLTRDDLRAYRSDVVAPLRTAYRGYTVFTTPPPSQGIILLIMLNILEGLSPTMLRWDNPDGIHLMVETKKRAFADRLGRLGDPRFVDNPIEELLSAAHAARHRDDILAGFDTAAAASGADGDTTYLCAADEAGNMVSLITSLSAKFGCGEVVEGTGILLNNRAGRGFTLQAGHPNCIAPGKRTMHTLMPFLAAHAAGTRIAFGTPGGDGQPQWNLQVFLNLVDGQMDPQEAVEAPHWLHFPGTDPAHAHEPFELHMEEGFPPDSYEALRLRGHRVVTPMRTPETPGAQVIVARGGVYRGGSDPRVDGLAIGY